MNTKQLRNFSFYLHRWLGLVAGILLCIAGLTGSILVFWHEIDKAVIAARFGRVIPGDTKVSLLAIAIGIPVGRGLFLTFTSPFLRAISVRY
jgi:uncharacterized iron-regulated membrane protein